MAVLDLVLGPSVIGVLFNVFLYGTMCMQCYHYFITFPKDSKAVRFFVWFLLILDTANTIFECSVLYLYTITDFGNSEAVAHGHWLAGTGPVLTAIVAACVQGFLARRVHKFTKTIWLSGPICIGIVVQFVAASAVGIAGIIITSFSQWDTWQFKLAIVTWLVCAAVVDCAITAVLTFYLRKSRTGFTSTDHMITRLIRLTIETGMVTAVWAVLDLILYLSVSQPIHMIFNIALPKLYSNTLLCTLNSRMRIGSNLDSSTATNAQSDATWKDCAHVSNAGATDRPGVCITTASQVHQNFPLELEQTRKEDFAPSIKKPDLDNKSDDVSDSDYDLSKRQDDEIKWAWKDCVQVSTLNVIGIPGAHIITTPEVHRDGEIELGEAITADVILPPDEEDVSSSPADDDDLANRLNEEDVLSSPADDDDLVNRLNEEDVLPSPADDDDLVDRLNESSISDQDLGVGAPEARSSTPTEAHASGDDEYAGGDPITSDRESSSREKDDADIDDKDEDSVSEYDLDLDAYCHSTNEGDQEQRLDEDEDEQRFDGGEDEFK